MAVMPVYELIYIDYAWRLGTIHSILLQGPTLSQEPTFYGSWSNNYVTDLSSY